MIWKIIVLPFVGLFWCVVGMMWLWESFWFGVRSGFDYWLGRSVHKSSQPNPEVPQ